MERILRETSSNAHYVCFDVEFENKQHQVVIPNNILYSIIRSESGEAFDLNTYVNLMAPIIAGDQELKLSKDTFDQIKPFVLPAGWLSMDIKVLDYFRNGVQHSSIADELVTIKKLDLAGYLIHKDDETGLLVLRKKE